MKVFYVVVLVLVAGAVPSHGRTESEGTVFNKTQLHESMSNVTVSSSKLVTYDFSYLAMQWPRSYCNSLNMVNRPVPARFTVHGLWPQSIPGGGIDCTNRRIYGQYPLFNSSQPNFRREFLGYLNYYWPDLITGVGYNYWRYEYNKHGSCTFNNQTRFFGLTLALARNFGNLNSGPTGFEGIIFDSPYSSDEIKGAVYGVTNKWPRLQCVRHGNRFLLLEIRFCVFGNQLTNCPYYTDCGNRNVYLPRP